MSPADLVLPSSCSTSFIAAKIGRSGQPVQNPGGRIGTVLPTGPGSPGPACWARGPCRAAARALSFPQELGNAVQHHLSGVFARHRQHTLAIQVDPAARAEQRWSPVACSMNSGWPSSTTSTESLPSQNSTRIRRAPADRSRSARTAGRPSCRTDPQGQAAAAPGSRHCTCRPGRRCRPGPCPDRTPR
jgi:hypothetical protein